MSHEYGKVCAVVLLFVSMEMKGGDMMPPQSYAAAAYSNPGVLTGGPEFTVFPDHGRPFAWPLPFPIGRFAVNFRGDVVYEQRLGTPQEPFNPALPALVRIDLRSSGVAPIRGSEGLRPGSALTVSSDDANLWVSGDYTAGGERRCGVFRLNMGTGTVQLVLQTPDCKYLNSWMSLSISPDQRYLLAIRGHNLYWVDLESNSARIISPQRFYKAQLSRDGKLIAAIVSDLGFRTELLDAPTGKMVRILSNSIPVWLPDSRFLLASSEAGKCPDESDSLSYLNIRTGKERPIASSHCMMRAATAFWTAITSEH